MITATFGALAWLGLVLRSYHHSLPLVEM